MSDEEQLRQSVLSCDLKLLKKLTKNISDINYKVSCTNDLTLLHIAAGIRSRKSTYIVSYLLEIHANPNARSGDGLTPTHIAALWNNCDALEKLIVFGGDPFLRDYADQDAFDMSLENDAMESYELLNCMLEESGALYDRSLKRASSKSSESYDSGAGILPFSETYIVQRNTPDKGESPSDKTFKFQAMRDWIEDVNNCHPVGSDPLVTTESSKPVDLNSNHPDIIGAEGQNCSLASYATCRYDSLMSDCEIETVYSDDEEGVVLIEKHSLPVANNSQFSETFNTCYSIQSDWKSLRTKYASRSTSEAKDGENNEVVISEGLKALTDMEIYDQLKCFNDNPGPVFGATRNLYLRRLAQLKSGLVCVRPVSELRYPPEVYSYLNGKLELDKLEYLDQKIAEEFDSGAMAGTYREGNQRNSFNYFLLDPRVTKNLPSRAHSMTKEEAFSLFLDALFYVGKGTKGRPYSHLYEAAKFSAGTDNQRASDKVAHILDIWHSGVGVISLHCFQNSIPVEAFTREASIIEATGIANLTNIKKGTFYGKANKWTTSKKRQLGVLLVSRAVQIFLMEGERLIRPKDLK